MAKDLLHTNRKPPTDEEVAAAKKAVGDNLAERMRKMKEAGAERPQKPPR